MLLYQVYGVPISGTLVQQAWTTDGSGSTYLWGYLDSVYRCSRTLSRLLLLMCTDAVAAFSVPCSRNVLASPLLLQPTGPASSSDGAAGRAGSFVTVPL